MMQEKAMVSDALNSINSGLKTYTDMISQTGHQELRSALQQMRNEAEKSQYELYTIAKNKNYYKEPAQASQNEINSIKSAFSGSSGWSGSTGMSGQAGGMGTSSMTGSNGSSSSMAGSTSMSGSSGMTGSTGMNGSTGMGGSSGMTGSTGMSGSSGMTGGLGMSGMNNNLGSSIGSGNAGK